MAFMPGKIHLEVVQAALSEPDLDAEPGRLTTALNRAAMIGDTDAVEAILARGVSVNARDASGRTPLIEASFGGHSNTVKFLLSRGAQVNIKDGSGWTALMEAASKVHTDVVKILLTAGARVNSVSDPGATPLGVTSKRQTKIKRLLRKAGASEG